MRDLWLTTQLMGIHLSMIIALFVCLLTFGKFTFPLSFVLGWWFRVEGEIIEESVEGILNLLLRIRDVKHE